MLCQNAKHHPILPSLGDHLFLFNAFYLTSIIWWWWSQSVSEASWNNTPCRKLWCPIVLHIYPSYIKHYIKQSAFQAFSLDIVSMLCLYLWDQKHAKVLNPWFWIETLCFTQDWALRTSLPSPQHATASTLNVTKNVTTVTSVESKDTKAGGFITVYSRCSLLEIKWSGYWLPMTPYNSFDASAPRPGSASSDSWLCWSGSENSHC